MWIVFNNRSNQYASGKELIMNKTITFKLSNLEVPFDNCSVSKDGTVVVILVQCDSEKKADDLITSLGAEPSF